MSTTSLFVELIVIGVSTLVWLALLIFAVFGYAWVPIDVLLSPAAAVPVLAVVYVLGIISDRIADAVFDRIWSDDLRGPYFQNKAEYYQARRRILIHSERLSDLLEYGRSRLRICRGWAFNSILVAIALNAFLWTNFGNLPSTWPVSIFSSIFLLALAVGAWFAWQRLVKAEYRKIKEQAAIFMSPETTDTDRF
jgi:hypothetical protein